MKCYYNFYHKEKQSKIPLKRCECDPECPEMIPSLNKRGQPAKYFKGHGGRGKPRLDMIGERNPRYRNGRRILGPYEQVKAPNHPNTQKIGYIQEHRFLMSEKLGRPLKPGEVVHHINGNKKDNRIENLQVMTRGEHQRYHAKKDMSKRVCKKCESNITHIDKKTGYSVWYGNEKDGFVCMRCYHKKK